MATNIKKDQVNLLRMIVFQITPLVTIICLSGFIVISSLVGMFPETFGPIFGSFINYREGGVYADCRLAKNRNNRICNGMDKETNHDRTWNSIQKGKKALPFNLH